MNYDQLREMLERTCHNVIENYKFLAGPEEKKIARAKLDGLFMGCLACAKALGEDTYQGGIMDIVRELTEKYQREI